jgi:S-DNA-T family DNA segregation ATPase FtsK/SpoIIIE
MDQLEHVGIVGSAQGSKPREVLIQDENQLNTLLLQLRSE